MRVELNVDLRPARSVSTKKSDSDPNAKAEQQRRDREERMLRRIPLARVIEAQIADGKFADLADVARRCGTSRARVSQITCESQSM